MFKRSGEAKNKLLNSFVEELKHSYSLRQTVVEAELPGDTWDKAIMREISLSAQGQEEDSFGGLLFLRFSLASILLALIIQTTSSSFVEQSSTTEEGTTIEALAQLDPFDISKVLYD